MTPAAGVLALLLAVSLCYTSAYSTAARARIVGRRFMFRRLCGRYPVIHGKPARGGRTRAGFLFGVLGLLACVVGCTGPNPFERARPPDVLAWDEARLADNPYFYQRFLAQYPTSAFAPDAWAR